jgi:hypothetical protein
MPELPRRSNGEHEREALVFASLSSADRSAHEPRAVGRRRWAGGARMGVALCNALCNGLHSACPLIPDSGVLFGASWIRPHPPNVTTIGGQVGSDPVLVKQPDRGSAGRQTDQEPERQRTEKTDNNKKKTTTATTARQEKRRGRGVSWVRQVWRVGWSG